MDDISSLLKEAKPLYFARKRRRRVVASALCGLICLWGVGSFYPQSNGEPCCWYYDTTYSLSENSSFVEDLGLPTDDYGLLKVV